MRDFKCCGKIYQKGGIDIGTNDIRTLNGIGPARAKLFEKKGITTVDGLLNFFPRTYEDRSNKKDIIECMPGEDVTVEVIILSPVKETRIRKNMTIYSLTAGDGSGAITVTWYNNRFVKGAFKTGGKYLFFGKINPHSRKKEMINPVFEQAGKEKYTCKIVPIYPLWGNMTQKIIHSAMSEAIKQKGITEDYLSPQIREKYKLCDIDYALENIHFPKTFDDFQTARKRLVFEELLFLQLALSFNKEKNKGAKRKPFLNTDCADEFIKTLSFSMTNAQLRTIGEILSDFRKDVPMNRLIQGDVGSGKTAVAAAAMYVTVKNGYQAAIMAPTEILAAQHYETFCKFFDDTDIRICLLTGSTKRKKDTYEKIQNKEYDIIIGTHAIIQEGVKYNNLGLVTVDEQHRFGVSQRAELTNKGKGVNTLVMTATPIPRTLSFILYGDLDISVIDELPPGRKPVQTYAVGEDMRKRIYDFVRKNIKSGRQCYVVCPLIEETQNSDLKNAVDICEKMRGIFADFRVELIHGRMRAQEKDTVMRNFAAGEIDILVSTTVIEVGVNVPNATLMIIENAERFGLSQLHQLRGRIGRGAEQSYCILFAHGGGDLIKKRMEVICKSNDGFFISEEDLKLRGPGDFFGTRQHGLPEMKIANLFSDSDMLKLSRKAANDIMEKDPDLSDKNNFGLRKKIKNMFREDIIIN